MEKMFTKFKKSLTAIALLFLGTTAFAQSNDANSSDPIGNLIASVNTPSSHKSESKAVTTPVEGDTSWHPVRRVWGYAFGDLYYVSHADNFNRGPENIYAGVPSSRNAFQFRRIYLGYDYEISPRFTAEMLLASEPSANTGVNGTTSIQNSDNLVDGKMAFFIKNFNLRYKNIYPGADFVIGELGTPGFALNEGKEMHTNAPNSLSESTLGTRFLEKTVSDFHKTNAYDVGAAIQGTFDPKTKNFGYVVMVGNNSTSSLLSAASPNTGFFKMFYGSLWGKFMQGHLVADLYFDNVNTAATTSVTLGPQSHSMFKAFVSYNSKPITVGVEAYTQSFKNGVNNTTAGTVENSNAEAFSIWAKGPIIKNKLSFFARRDAYDPNTKFNGADVYTVNTNYSSYSTFYRENYYSFGLDFTPIKNVHFTPNYWILYYRDKRNSNVSGYQFNDHTEAYRFTFYYVFGK